MTVRKDKLLAGYNGNLESVIVYDNTGSQKVEVQNGVWVVLEGLEQGQREVRKARLASESDVEKELYFIHNSEVMYDERLSKLSDYVREAGKVSRAYSVHQGDIVTLTTDLFDGVVAVGDKLIAKTNGLIGKPTSDETLKTTATILEVIENCGNEIDDKKVAYAVQVIK